MRTCLLAFGYARNQLSTGISCLFDGRLAGGCLPPRLAFGNQGDLSLKLTRIRGSEMQLFRTSLEAIITPALASSHVPYRGIIRLGNFLSCLIATLSNKCRCSNDQKLVLGNQ